MPKRIAAICALLLVLLPHVRLGAVEITHAQYVLTTSAGSSGSSGSSGSAGGGGGGGGNNGGGGQFPTNPGIITNTIPGCDFQTGRFHADCIPRFIAHVIRLVFMLTGMFFVINVMIAGYQIAIGSVIGDKEKGKSRLWWSIIGFGASACCFMLIDAVMTIFTSSV